MVGTAPGGFDLGGETALSHRDDVTKGRQALAIMALLEVAACGFEPLFCMGRPIPEEAALVDSCSQFTADACGMLCARGLSDCGRMQNYLLKACGMLPSPLLRLLSGMTEYAELCRMWLRRL